MILADAYEKAGRNDDLWRYLNFLTEHGMADPRKIHERQARVLRQEGKHLDALYHKMTAMLYTPFYRNVPPPDERIQKELQAFAKRAGLSEQLTELVAVFQGHLREEEVRQRALKESLRAIIDRCGAR